MAVQHGRPSARAARSANAYHSDSAKKRSQRISKPGSFSSAPAVNASWTRGTGSSEVCSTCRVRRFGEHHAQFHCGPNPAELAGRVTDDCRWSEEILLEEMVEEVLQAGRDAVIVSAADDRERIDLAVEPSQRFEDGRSAAPLIFLVHAVEQRQVQFGGVDDFCRVPAPPQAASRKRTTRMPARASRTEP
jgi:hypothetical protein